MMIMSTGITARHRRQVHARQVLSENDVSAGFLAAELGDGLWVSHP